MKFPFLFKATEITTTTTSSAASSWPWPSCSDNPKTLSFRANNIDNIYTTMNSTYLHDINNFTEFPDINTPDSFLSVCNSFEHYHEEIFSPEYEISAVVGGLRSERLFFDPGETSSILEDAKLKHDSWPCYKESVEILAIDSSDPFQDFRASMEEVVEAHGGMRDWEFMEELLACYLRVNGKSNHGYILGAFVDLLVHLAFVAIDDDDEKYCSLYSSAGSDQNSFTSPLSFSSSSYSSTRTSHCLSNSVEINEDDENIDVQKDGDGSSSSSFLCSSA